MQLCFYLSLLLPGMLAFSSPTPVDKRAGAPVRSPIPASCTVSDPLPSTAEVPAGATPTASSLKPSDDFYNEHILYSYYLSAPPPDSNASSLVTDCQETCYSYGNHTECQAAWFAYYVQAPPDQGGQVSNYACLNFDAPLEESDSEDAAAGRWINGTVANIAC
ncbi:MAG: hypothetical protein M1820_004533 [Bogoriella megaspora]|nr:MAG: hypothetical protein M1820_004533 [Bogoriella megaspora]